MPRLWSTRNCVKDWHVPSVITCKHNVQQKSYWTRPRKRSKLAGHRRFCAESNRRRNRGGERLYVNPGQSNSNTRATMLGSGSTRQPKIRCPFPQSPPEDRAPQGSRGLASRASRWDRSEALAFLSLGARPLASFSGNLRQPPASPTPRRLHWLSERGISTVVLRSTNA